MAFVTLGTVSRATGLETGLACTSTLTHAIASPAPPPPLLSLQFMLWFGFYGFNSGSVYVYSTLAPVSAVNLVAMNTTLAASSAGLASLLLACVWTGVRVRVWASDGCGGKRHVCQAGCTASRADLLPAVLASVCCACVLHTHTQARMTFASAATAC
jgi:ammonia channel protein AmtB